MITTFHQIENTNKETEVMKKKKKKEMKTLELQSTKAEIREITSGAQQQMWSGRTKNQGTWGRIHWYYPVWGTEKKRMKKNEQSLINQWSTNKCTNISIMEVLEERKVRKGQKKISEEIIVENFTNLIEIIYLYIQHVWKTQRVNS